MSVTLNINGNDYFYPQTGDVAWGPDATDWAVAVTSGMLQKAGGLFQLLGEVDFGPNFGLKSIYFLSRTADAADAGSIRLANTDVINFRNFANSGNLALSVDSSDNLLFNGQPIGVVGGITDTNSIDLTITGNDLSADLKLSADLADPGYTLVDLSIETDGLKAQFLTPATFIDAVSDTATIDLTITSTTLSADIVTGSISNSLIAASAAIALNKLAATTASRALVSDGSGFISPATTTATEIGYVNGVTSSIQTQLNSKQATGNYITSLTGDVTASGPGAAAATIAAGVIVDSMVNASAAIAQSKLALSITNSQLSGSAGITNANLATMAAHTFKGNNTGSSATPIDMTATQATAELDVMTGDLGAGGLKGLVPAQTAGDATKFLKGDGTWASAGGSGGFNVVPLSSNHNALSSEYGYIFHCDTSGGAFSITLPTPASGANFYIKDATGSFGTNQLTIVRSASEQIEGLAASKILYANWGYYLVYSDGTNWYMGA